MRFVHAALATIVACLALTATASAQTTAPKLFGFNDNTVLSGQLTAAKDAQLASQIGVTAQRMTFDWRWAEPQPGVWDLARYDAFYEENLAKGIKPVFILMWAPPWADGVDCAGDCKYPPAPEYMDAWRNAVRKLITRYPQMGALEIWNEPNTVWTFQSGVDPARYTELLSEAYDTVRAAGSPIPVLGGSIMSNIMPSTATTMNHREFLKGMYAAGAKGKMDGLAIHPYPWDPTLRIFFHMLSDVRDVRAENGDDVPLWVTETGVTTTPSTQTYTVSENDQAVYLQKLYNELNAMKDVRAIMFHTLVDNAMVAASDYERGFGTMRVDLSPKPAYCMFASLRRSRYKCPRSVKPMRVDATQEARWQAQHYVQAALDAARTYRLANGSYVGLTTAKLNSLDPQLSATEPVGDALPGSTADPTRVGVWVLADQDVLVCNNSKADRSYCIMQTWGKSPVYGATASSIYGTAGAITGGSVVAW